MSHNLNTILILGAMVSVVGSLFVEAASTNKLFSMSQKGAILQQKVEGALSDLDNAIQNRDITKIGTYQKLLLKYIRKEPNLLWKSCQDNVVNAKIIDLIAPFGLMFQFYQESVGNASLPRWQAAGMLKSEMVQAMSDLYSSCLLLSTRSILGHKPCTGKRYDLLRDREKADSILFRLHKQIKIVHALMYVGTAQRYTMFVQESNKIFPDDIERLIGAFCFGIEPDSKQQITKDLDPIDARVHVKWHESHFFLQNRIRDFCRSNYADPFSILYDQDIIRSFIWAGLTEKDFWKQVANPLELSIKACIKKKWMYQVGLFISSIILCFLAKILLSVEKKDFSKCYILMASVLGTVGLGYYLLPGVLHELEVEQKRLRSQLARLSEHWPTLVAKINAARLPFEEGADDIVTPIVVGSKVTP